MHFKYTTNTLKKLEELYEESRYTVRYEKGTFNSGYCILEDRRIIVVNKFLSLEGRINALLELLHHLQVSEDTLSQEAAKWYRQFKEQTSASAIQSQMNF
jgi:hypothetical protein